MTIRLEPKPRDSLCAEFENVVGEKRKLMKNNFVIIHFVDFKKFHS